MQTLRFNPFNHIHKGLRALLYDTAMLLQRTNFTNEDEVHAVVERVKLVNTLFAGHAHHEDTLVFPMIEAIAPALVADFEAQHQVDHALSDGLAKCLSRFTETNSPEQNIYAGNELLQSFNAFLAFNVEHMKKEETEVNACLWQHYSDRQLQQKVQEISAANPPAENRTTLFWMIKGLGTHEIIEWFNGIKLSAPPPVFAMLCETAESALSNSDWCIVKEALQEGALLA